MSGGLFAAALVFAAAAAGGGLGWLAQRLHSGEQRGGKMEQLIARIDAQLPQLQCGDCGYPGCRPYAAAIARGEAGIDLCPPGGSGTAQRLAQLLNVAAPKMPAAAPPRIAQIDPGACIGCALCLPACPTDAIIGTARHTHSVVAAECVGCELCLPPCPVDCIQMVDTPHAR